jgi:hypothetical protein
MENVYGASKADHSYMRTETKEETVQKTKCAAAGDSAKARNPAFPPFWIGSCEQAEYLHTACSG